MAGKRLETMIRVERHKVALIRQHHCFPWNIPIFLDHAINLCIMGARIRRETVSAFAIAVRVCIGQINRVMITVRNCLCIAQTAKTQQNHHHQRHRATTTSTHQARIQAGNPHEANLRQGQHASCGQLHGNQRVQTETKQGITRQRGNHRGHNPAVEHHQCCAHGAHITIHSANHQIHQAAHAQRTDDAKRQHGHGDLCALIG